MSTFSGLNTAASGLAAARLAMDVTGQNLANQNTQGYTRQRVEISAIGAVAQAGRFSVGAVPGGGVAIEGIARLGDAVLDARVRDTLAASGFWSSRAVATTTAEAALAEPTDDGLAARLSGFWAAWQDLANTPDVPAAGAVVIESGRELAARLATGYRAVADQWSELRGTVDTMTTQVNAAASQIAALNGEIRDALATGQSANELIDRRGVLAQTVARLVGGRSAVEADGTLTVRVDGNALVSATTARPLVASGARSLESGTAVTLSWADAPDRRVVIDDGELGGVLSVLAPGGALSDLAAGYNDTATALADAVNAQHRAGVTSAGAVGGDFFQLAATGPAALGLQVVPTSNADLAIAGAGSGAWDASNADALSQLGTGDGSVDALWAALVTRFGVATAGDIQRAGVAESSAATTVSAQQSVAAVSSDEETIALLTYQTAYQASARVITAIDEALDLLINGMGVVGR